MNINTHTSKRGAAMVLFVLFFAFATSAMMFVLGQSIFADLSHFSRLVDSKRAYLASESILEDVVYRHVFGTFAIDGTESLTIGGITAYATSTHDSVTDTYEVLSSAQGGNTIRKTRALLTIGAGSAFNYGLQSGNGGISLANNATIVGNVYSNGSIVGPSNKADITGDVVSAGPSGLARRIRATGSIYANTIDRIDAGGDAHYNVQNGSNAQNPVAGTRYTPAPNQPLLDFPISSTTIQEWKDSVTTYGTVISATDPACSGGTYTIDTHITIGYIRIECDVDIEKKGASTVVTLTGPVWIQGNLSFTQGPTIRVHPSLGRRSVQFIVDNPADRLTSSQIEIRNSTTFIGSGDSRSFIMLMSLNESAREGGSEEAIKITQSAIGSVIAYADAGLVSIGNGIGVKSLTGYQIDIAQNTNVVYESGLASALFTSGPGGGYVLADWRQRK
jgi:hypothetical protein